MGGLTTGLTVALPPLPVILPPFVLDPDPESAPGWHDADATGLVKLLLHNGLPPTLGEIEDWCPLNWKIIRKNYYHHYIVKLYITIPEHLIIIL